MTLNEYTDPARFPLTTQRGLDAADQIRIDAFNYDQLQEACAEGFELDDEQRARLAELEIKVKEHFHLIRESSRTKEDKR